MELFFYLKYATNKIMSRTSHLKCGIFFQGDDKGHLMFQPKLKSFAISPKNKTKKPKYCL